MLSKIGVLIRCYSITDYLPYVLKNYAWVDKIAVMNYRFISAEPRKDDTGDIVKSFDHHNINLYQGEGLKQHEILNEGLKHLQDCDVVFISDADEFIALPSMKDIVNLMVHGEYNIGYCRIIDYAFDFNHRFNNRHLNYVLVAVNPKNVEFVKIRIIKDKSKGRFFDHTLHHFGFVLPRETMKWKLKWESKEEGIDVVSGIKKTNIVLCGPPEHEILELMGEN